MTLIRTAIANPVTVVVGVFFVVLFGVVNYIEIPYQLSPNVATPTVMVSTPWPGATPYEIERDILEEQERVLKGITGLQRMEGNASNGSAVINLEFDLGTDLDAAMLRVSNALDEVPSYPENVDKPILNGTGGEASPVIYMVLKPLEGNERSIYTYRTYFEDEIRQYLERVEGVADIVVYGGVENEMHVVLDPHKVASYGLSFSEVIRALRGDNVNVSAGTMPVGRREYRVRALSEYNSPQDIEDVVVVSDGQRRVRVRDLGHVEAGYSKFETPGLQDGTPGVTVAVRPEPDANILDMTDAMEAAVADVQKTLNENKLELIWVYDQRPYINGAIQLLRQNIVIGAVLAVMVLLFFMRSIASILIIGTAIPISVIGSFMVMRALGTTLNVVSLAGIAFAVGMLVDNAIVVLENIDRHRRMGKNPFAAAFDGAREVWGAVLASSLTTVAVFLPIIFLQDEAGLLFRDIAVAVTSAVTLSLLVSITVIPTLSRKLFENRLVDRIEGRAAVEGAPSRLGTALSNMMMGLVGIALRSPVTRLATIGLLVGGAGLAAWVLTPKMEYLPKGNRDLIFNIMVPPPGLSYDERMQIGKNLFEFIEPYYKEGHNGKPAIRRTFLAAPQGLIMMGIISGDQARTAELIPVAQEMVNSQPGIFGISEQSSIFNQGIGRGRNIDIDFSGPILEDLVDAAGRTMGIVQDVIPQSQIRPVPSLDLLYPEVQFIPDGDKLRAVGMTAQDFGIALDILMDGRPVADYKEEGKKKVDLVVKVASTDLDSPTELYDALIPTPSGMTVPVSSLATMEETSGVTSIRHLERNRTISLQVTPPYEVTIQEAMERIEQTIVPQLRAEGMLEDISIGLSGSADKLTQTRTALQWNFLLAVIITYLLMSALFGNFLYPFVIMFTVPLAGAGGLIGLKLVNWFIAPQQLDILTMLGFIILIGVVVNNAILIVHQSLNNVRDNDMDYNEAVREAVRSRLRPIYMTATTSICGMLPLVLVPGPGSEFYRGLGSVVLGGLALSTVFTVFLIPSLLLFVIRFERAKVPVQDRTTEPIPAK